MKTLRSPLAGLFLAVLGLALAFPLSVRGDDTRSYHNSSTLETSHPAWMKWVPDDTLLTEMSIPGTHDSMSRYHGDLVETQELELRDQLDSGIRYLDIRFRYYNDRLTIVHGFTGQYASFDEVLGICNEFLEDNPTETIVMTASDTGVSDEDFLGFAWNEEDCTKTKEEIRTWYKTSPLGARLFSANTAPDEESLTLGLARGKIIWWNEDYSWEHMNMWDLDDVWERDEKWEFVQDYWEYVDGDVATFVNQETPDDESGSTFYAGTSPTKLHVNDSAGSSSAGGVYPDYVASYVNPRMLAYLFEGSQTRTVGTVRMDFPGAALISAIIAHNLKRATNDTDRATFRDSFKTIFSDTCYALNDDDYDDDSLTSRATALQRWLGHILPWRGPQFSVRDHWSVIVKEGDRGFENWAVVSGETGGMSLLSQSEWIDDRSYVAVNAVTRADLVTTNELSSYLTTGPFLKLEFVSAMDAAGDCRERARALKTLVRDRFPGVRWNVAVSRTVPLGVALDTRASVSTFGASASGAYFYYVWAGSRNESTPVPSAGGPYTAAEGETVTFDASATADLDNGVLTYRWDFDNNGTWDVVTSAAQASRVFPNQGIYPVRLQVSDGENTANTTTTVTVNNVAPMLNLGSATASVLAGDAFHRACFFTDPGSDTWSVTVDYGDGTPLQNIPYFNKWFNLGHLYAAAGTYPVTVTVNDGTVSTPGTLSVTVAAPGPPIIHSFTGPSGPVPEGSTTTVNGSFYYGVWSQTLGIAWGDGSPNTQPVVLSTGGGNYTFTAQHTYPDLPPGGAAHYTITAAWPGWTALSLPVTVVDVPPTFSTLTIPSTVPEGALVQVGYTINAPTQDTLIKRVDWGDGASQIWTGGPLTSISPPHTYPTAGTYLMTIRVTDEDRSTDVETRTITVTDAAPSIFDLIATSAGVQEGGSASVLGHFQSPNLAHDQFTVEIDWGDGRPPTAVPYHAVGDTTAEFSATHVYFDNNGANPWTATVRVTDDDGSVAKGSVAIPVSNRPPVVDAVPNFALPTGVALSKSGRITDPGSDTFTGTVDYGDGTGVQPLGIIGNSYQLSHNYAANGVYTIMVNVTDDDGAGASGTLKLLVGATRDLLVANTNDAGPGSLRQAVLEANTPSLNSTAFPTAYADIRFDPALSGLTIVLTSGQLLSSLRTRLIATNLPVGITVSGSHVSRILEVAANNAVVLDTLHLTNGFTPAGGGAILVNGEAGLTLNRCTISGCTTSDRGGGIFFIKGAALTVNQSTVFGCLARNGGGIYFYGLGGKELRAENSTFTGNSATGASSSAGGAIFNESGRLVLNHSTVAGNTAAGTSSKGGGIHSSSNALLEVNNSIVAGNTGATSANVSGSNSGTGSLTSGDPMLFPLGNYGGPTLTMPPRPGSPAIDAVTSVRLSVNTTSLARWRLGEEDAGASNGGTATSSANTFGRALTFNHPVTYSGSVSPFAAGWLDSRLGVTFAVGTYGTNDLVADFLGNTAITDNFGIELWVKADDLNGNKCLAYNGDTSANGWGLYQFGDSYGALFGGVTLIGNGFAPVTPGTWTHLAVVRDSGVTKVYVNGVVVDSTSAAPHAPSDSFAIGAPPQWLNQEFFNGALDEVRVFSFNPGQFSPGDLSYQPTTPVGFSYLPGSDGADVWHTDQRGLPRVSGRAADIGAIEIDQQVVRLTNDSGNGSLRQTLADSVVPGIITFAPALSSQTVQLTGGQLVLDQAVLLDASALPGGLTVSAGRRFRVMETTGDSVMLSSLRITGGSVGRGNGGGAGIKNSGHLTLNRCIISGNTVYAAGGGLYITGGTVTLNECTVSGNSVSSGAGGGIANPGGALTVNQCTLTGNRSDAGGAISFGGGGGTVSVNQSTLTGNQARSLGGGIFHVGGSLAVFNSIVAGNSQSEGGDVRGPVDYTGLNLTSGNPLLAPLGFYGGPTRTMPPLPGSAAVDAGAPTTFFTDQRGASRVSGPAVDLGSVEAFSFGSLPLEDTDTDGADDRLELGYFGNLTTVTSSSDFDGDGSLDVVELANGTNPLDPGSFNSTPTIACPEPVVRDCVPLTGMALDLAVTVSDADLGQQLTLSLKEGVAVLRQQAFAALPTGSPVTFSGVVLEPGSHTLTVEVSDGLETSTCQFSVQLNAAGVPGTVVGRHVFYNQSVFDGNDPAANAADDGAIAPDKQALLPGGLAGFANYTSYTKGLNGLILDVAGLALPAALTAADFVFTTGNDNLSDAWAPALPPASVTVRPGAGVCGADRITLIWDASGSDSPNEAVAQGWLKVRLLANERTGLLLDDAFYFGNAVGESDDTDTLVAAQDALRALNRVSASAGIANPLDFNRDGLVAAQDALLVLNHVWTGFRLPDLRPAGNASPASPWTAEAEEALRLETRRWVAEALAAGGAARFTAIERLPDGRVRLAWELPTGRRARLLTGDTLGGPWQAQPSEPLTDEGRLSLSGGPEAAARFYRLELLPAGVGPQ